MLNKLLGGVFVECGGLRAATVRVAYQSTRDAAMRVPRNRMLAVVLAASVASVIGGCGARFDPRPAPAVTFVTVQGETIKSEALRGKVVVVNFWATDCPVCLREMPRLVETHRKFQARGLETVAVAMWHDPPIRVTQYLDKNPLPFKVAFDPVGEHARAFGDLTVTPTTFVIDKRGMIVSRTVGEPDFTRLHQLLESKIAEAG